MIGFVLLAALILVPIIEIAVFIEVGGRIGVWPTLIIILLTAVIGAALIRQQGISTLYKFQEKSARGEMPVREMFDGMCLLFAGALLLTPGFVTDTIGFLLLVPPVRTIFFGFTARYIAAHGSFTFYSSTKQRTDSDTIEGEYEEVHEPGPDKEKGRNDKRIKDRRRNKKES